MNNNPPAIFQPSPLPARSAPILRWLAFIGALVVASAAGLTSALAQTPLAPTEDPAAIGSPVVPPSSAVTGAPATPVSALGQLAWLHGCWDGKVNQRDFREEWLPLRGDMMIGVSHTVSQGKTQDFEYLRLELRPEGVFYVAAPSGRKETSFRFSGKTQDGGREIYTFDNPLDEFPQRIIYQRGSEGWLYAHVEGKLEGHARSVIYPMRRVDCTSGELMRQ